MSAFVRFQISLQWFLNFSKCQNFCKTSKYLLKAVFLKVLYEGGGLQKQNKFPSDFCRRRNCPDSKKIGLFENRKFWRFWNRQFCTNRTIFDGFVAIIALYPICTKLTISKSPEFAIFKKTIFFFESGQFLLRQKSQGNLFCSPQH